MANDAVRVAAIDCGTNSIRLLVSDLDRSAGVQHDVDRRMRIVRLGQDVDRTGLLAPEALARTFAACEEYADVCGDLGVARLRFCATSAARDAANAGLFRAGVRERLGVDAEVIPGAEEARLSALGALRNLPGLAADEPLALVADIGGGSTELVECTNRQGCLEVSGARSYDVGSVRITERHLHDDPPTPQQVAAAAADVDATFAPAAAVLGTPHVLVGVAGTVTTLTAHALDLPTYNPARIHAARMPVSTMRASCAAMVAASVAERRAMPYMHPGRADVIGGGALVLDRLLSAAVVATGSVMVSEHDILDGIAWSLVEP